MISVSIIGVGRVGGALALSLPSDRFRVEELLFRGNSKLVGSLAVVWPDVTVSTLNEVADLTSDILFITTQDSEVASVAKQLASKLTGKPFVFHTSGALSSKVLDELRMIGCKTGSMHPLVSISCAESGPERFADSYFCIEGGEEAVDMARLVATSLGGTPFSIDTKFKTLYHAAAVTACGHMVALFDAAVEMMSKTGMSADESRKILLPLVDSTVQNLQEHGIAEALTGTFARADTETFVEHLKTLNLNVSDDLLEIYLLLGERSLELAAKRGVSPERIDSMRTKVSIAKSKLKW